MLHTENIVKRKFSSGNKRYFISYDVIIVKLLDPSYPILRRIYGFDFELGLPANAIMEQSYNCGLPDS